MRLRENDILIMEGIHGLNPLVAQDLAQDELFRIYVNALTHLNLDAHTRIPTKDYRLIRRLVRDRHSRGCSAAETLRRFPRVREGEDATVDLDKAAYNPSPVYPDCWVQKYGS